MIRWFGGCWWKGVKRMLNRQLSKGWGGWHLMWSEKRRKLEAMKAAKPKAIVVPPAFVDVAMKKLAALEQKKERACVCTMDYRPHCGVMRDGTRETFSNKCQAANCAGALVSADARRRRSLVVAAASLPLTLARLLACPHQRDQCVLLPRFVPTLLFSPRPRASACCFLYQAKIQDAEREVPALHSKLFVTDR